MNGAPVSRDAAHHRIQATPAHQCRRDYKSEKILRARLLVPIGSDGDLETPSWVKFALRRGGR